MCEERNHQKERLEIYCTSKIKPSLLFPKISWIEEEENAFSTFLGRLFVNIQGSLPEPCCIKSHLSFSEVVREHFNPPPPIHFLPCRVACRILVPQPGIKPVLPALGAQSLNCWTTRDVPGNILNEWIFSMESVNKQLIKVEFHIIFLRLTVKEDPLQLEGSNTEDGCGGRNFAFRESVMV